MYENISNNLSFWEINLGAAQYSSIPIFVVLC